MYRSPSASALIGPCHVASRRGDDVRSVDSGICILPRKPSPGFPHFIPFRRFSWLCASIHHRTGPHHQRVSSRLQAGSLTPPGARHPRAGRSGLTTLPLPVDQPPRPQALVANPTRRGHRPRRCRPLRRPRWAPTPRLPTRQACQPQLLPVTMPARRPEPARMRPTWTTPSPPRRSRVRELLVARSLRRGAGSPVASVGQVLLEADPSRSLSSGGSGRARRRSSLCWLSVVSCGP